MQTLFDSNNNKIGFWFHQSICEIKYSREEIGIANLIDGIHTYMKELKMSIEE